MLTQLQGKAGLLRQLGFVSATALVVSNMVGMGIFTTTGFMARDLGSAKLILAVWLAGALFALAGALSYSELGIFTTTGFMARDLGSAKLILAVWLAGALFALAGALSYSELGINFPSSGGEYVYLTRAFGPAWGFMTGWISFFAGFSAPIAAAALAFSNYLGYFFPALK